jgi:hypothetical protein
MIIGEGSDMRKIANIAADVDKVVGKNKVSKSKQAGVKVQDQMFEMDSEQFAGANGTKRLMKILADLGYDGEVILSSVKDEPIRISLSSEAFMEGIAMKFLVPLMKHTIGLKTLDDWEEKNGKLDFTFA